MRKYSVDVLGQIYYYRLLTRAELREIHSQSEDDPLLFEDLVFHAVALDLSEDFDFENCLAFIPTRVAEASLKAGGYLGSENLELVEKAGEWVATNDARTDILICFCFPGMTLNTLESMEPEDYYRYVMAAYVMARSLHGMEEIAEFLDPSPTPTPTRPPNLGDNGEFVFQAGPSPAQKPRHLIQ